MKNKYFYLFLLLLLMIHSCEKDGKDNVNPSFRLIESMVRNSEADKIKATYHYKEEKLDEIYYYKLNFNGVEKLHSKATAHYASDGVCIVTYFYDTNSDEWLRWYKNVYTVKNNLILEEKYYDAESSWRYTYEYEDEKLVAWTGYDDNSGEPFIKGEYSYNFGLISDFKAYYYFNNLIGWKLIDKETIEHTEGNVSNINNYKLDTFGNWVNEIKLEYIYEDDKISKINQYNWTKETWNKSAYSTYEYNMNSCLMQIINSDASRAQYKYEEGVGNLKLFYYYPEELVYNQPTIKTARKDKNQFMPYTPYYLRYFHQNIYQLAR